MAGTRAGGVFTPTAPRCGADRRSARKERHATNRNPDPGGVHAGAGLARPAGRGTAAHARAVPLPSDRPFILTPPLTPFLPGQPGIPLRRTIDTNLYPNARCNDGTPAVMYIRPANGLRRQPDREREQQVDHLPRRRRRLPRRRQLPARALVRRGRPGVRPRRQDDLRRRVRGDPRARHLRAGPAGRARQSVRRLQPRPRPVLQLGQLDRLLVALVAERLHRRRLRHPVPRRGTSSTPSSARCSRRPPRPIRGRGTPSTRRSCRPWPTPPRSSWPASPRAEAASGTTSTASTSTCCGRPSRGRSRSAA